MDEAPVLPSAVDELDKGASAARLCNATGKPLRGVGTSDTQLNAQPAHKKTELWVHNTILGLNRLGRQAAEPDDQHAHQAPRRTDRAQ